MTDLELINRFCETSLEFINPLLFKDIQERNLVDIVNRLPRNKEEAKAVAYARLYESKRVFGDPEIDEIGGNIRRYEILRKKLTITDPTDVHKTVPLLEEMIGISLFIKDYFKK